MIRSSRALLLASGCLALSACQTVGSHPPRQAAVAAPAAPATQTGPQLSLASPPPEHGWLGGGHDQGKPVFNTWPQAYADLPPDPAMRFGVLPNGLRYVVMKNATPSGQSSIRLNIGSGSLEETPQQQGLAHLLEHMAFNGSTHVPYGEMIKILERHGLAFGADTNASTGWEETTYKLDLPKSDDSSVDDSLMLLREIAGELTLDQAIMDKEKGVVLSEERLRDTPNYHVQKAALGLELQGQLAADRFPIGKIEAVQGATHALLEDYYRRYYRPERSVLIVTGDVDPTIMEAKIKARFGDWKGRGPAGGEPDRGTPLARGPVTKLVVEDGVEPIVRLSWVRAPDLSLDGTVRRRREMIEQLGLGVLNLRLDRIMRADNPPFLGAAAYEEDQFHSADATEVEMVTQPDGWRAALDAGLAETRRLLQYGVTPIELAQVIDSQRAALKQAADTQATRTTPSLADNIAATVSTPEVETSPSEDLALFEEQVKGLTPAMVDAALKPLFDGAGPLVLVANPDTVDHGNQAVSEALAADQAAPVAPPSTDAEVTWPYDNFGPAGEVAERTDVADLDTVFVRFKNGVRLTIKPTKFRDDQILVETRIGHGDLELPTDRPSTTWSASEALIEGGLGKLTAQQVDVDTRSKILSKQFLVGEDAFAFEGETRKEDLDAQLQLMTAFVTDAGWRPEGFDRLKSFMPTYYNQIAATPSGVMGHNLGRLLHSGDQRWAMPELPVIQGQTMDQLKATLQPVLTTGPIEVVMVGDVNVDKAIAAVAQTFGALPPRADTPVQPAELQVTFPAGAPEPIVETHKGRADQAMGFIAWPTTDFLSDTQTARTLSILAEVMQIRALDQLRRAEGVTYSPSVGSSPSSDFPHYGYLDMTVEMPPAKLPGFFKDANAIAADLRTTLVGDDEFKRALQPAVESLLKRRETNEYWLTALSGAQQDPRKVAAIRTSIAQLSRVTPEDVRRAAQTYLVDSKAWKLEIKPVGAP